MLFHIESLIIHFIVSLMKNVNLHTLRRIVLGILGGGVNSIFSLGNQLQINKGKSLAGSKRSARSEMK